MRRYHMRCKACNKILEDSELTRKDSRGEFYDLCGVCLSSVYACELEDDDFFEEYSNRVLTTVDEYETLY